ncbi:hypothetical protein ACOSQ2_009738 [Xanthoceras sorbifolium]
MKSRESVTDYFLRTMAIVNKMRIHGDKTKYNLRIVMNFQLMNYRSECQTNLNKERGEMSNFTEKQEEVVFLLMACHAKEENHRNMWYLDTGCTNHMCGEKFAFSKLDELFRNTVKFGDNSQYLSWAKEMCQSGLK